MDGYQDRVTIGELWGPLNRWFRYYGKNGDELHLPFNFRLMHQPCRQPPCANQQMRWKPPCLVLLNFLRENQAFALDLPGSARWLLSTYLDLQEALDGGSLALRLHESLVIRTA